MTATVPQHKFHLSGPMGKLVFPAVCANCGSGSRQTLAVENIFTRARGEGSAKHVVKRLHVPFCDACVAAHWKEARVISPSDRFFLCFRTFLVIPAIGLGGFAAFFGLQALKDMLRADTTGAAISSMIGAGFLVAFLISLRAAYNDTARLAVVPATSVTSAFDFSDDRSSLFEPEHRLYWVRNDQFAEQFAALNRDRVWHAGGKAARSAKAWRTYLYVAAGVAVAVVAFWKQIAWFLDHL